MKKHDVIIVGAGIGGSTCAFYCQKAGLNTILVEKEQFPRDKVCGDGLQAPMMPVFEEMGILDEIKSYCYENSALAYVDGDENRIMIPYDPPRALHLSCPRFIYDNIVNKAAVRSGVDYLEGFDAQEILTKRGQACGVRGLYNGKVLDLEADLVILASGSHSMLARQAGFYEEDPDYVFYGLRGYFDNVGGIGDEEEFHFPEIFRDGGYIWFFPEADLENGTKRCNVGVFITEANLKDTGMTTEEILWWWRDNYKYGRERLGNATLVGELKGWRLPTGKHKPIHAAGVLAVGDSGNMIDPCFGGGAGAAVISGKIAAGFAAKAKAANDFSEEFLSEYEELIGKYLGPLYDSCNMSREYGYKNYETVKRFFSFIGSHDYGFDSLNPYLRSLGIETDIGAPYQK